MRSPIRRARYYLQRLNTERWTTKKEDRFDLLRLHRQEILEVTTQSGTTYRVRAAYKPKLISRWRAQISGVYIYRSTRRDAVQSPKLAMETSLRYVVKGVPMLINTVKTSDVVDFRLT